VRDASPIEVVEGERRRSQRSGDYFSTDDFSGEDASFSLSLLFSQFLLQLVFYKKGERKFLTWEKTYILSHNP
jgi:hypothetical protein